jgi:hypothetical protein
MRGRVQVWDLRDGLRHVRDLRPFGGEEPAKNVVALLPCPWITGEEALLIGTEAGAGLRLVGRESGETLWEAGESGAPCASAEALAGKVLALEDGRVWLVFVEFRRRVRVWELAVGHHGLRPANKLG